MSQVPAAIGPFVDKWWQREPEMRVAAEFSAGQAPAFLAWGALLHELRESLFELADPGVAAAKRGWWAEELQAIGARRARHPLGEALAAWPQAAVPWTGLALALVGAGGEARAADTAAAIDALAPIARASIEVENALFQARDAQASAARALAVHWLLQRLPHGLGAEDGARVPMHLLARHGLTQAQLPTGAQALLRDWAQELEAALPASVQGAYLRRARARFDRARLRRLAAKGGQGGFAEPAPIATLWRAWRAARGA